MRYVRSLLVYAVCVVFLSLLIVWPVLAEDNPKPTVTCPQQASAKELPHGEVECFGLNYLPTTAEKVTCPSGFRVDVKTQRIDEHRSHTSYRCQPKPSEKKCQDGQTLENNVCIDKAKLKKQSYDNITRKIPVFLVTKFYNDKKNSPCIGDGIGAAPIASCYNASRDVFMERDLTDVVYQCSLETEKALNQRNDDVGYVPTYVMATCLSKHYPSVDRSFIIKTFGDELNDEVFAAAVNQARQGTEFPPEVVDNNPQGDNGSSDENSADACSENLDGIGWLVCPVLWATAKAADGALEILKHFLNVPPEILAVNSPTFQAWSYFRNIANAMFAVVFLWLIFSQITNMGIDNYGIKKMLPRLIVGAILVNISFYITQIAVDLSNILGYSLEDMLEKAMTSVKGGSGHGIDGWQVVLSGIFIGLAGGALIVGIILIGQSVLLACLLAVAITLCIIIARQALVVLLVVLSPVAFVSWLLPNTESLFKKWFSLLRAMLVLFPIIALIYGGGKLGSHILMNVATSNSGDTNEFLQIAALGVAFLPLGFTPTVLRSSFNMLGSLSNKLSKASKWANHRIGTAVRDKSRLGEMWNNQKLQSLKRRADRRRGESKIARYGRQITQDPNSTKLGMFLSSKIGSDKVEKLGRAMSFKGDMTKLIDESPIGVALGGVGGQAAATRRASEVFEKEVKDSSLLLQGKQMDEIKDFATGAVKTSGAMRAAAIDHVMSQGGFSDRRSVIESVASDAKMDTSMRQRAIDGAYAKGDGNIYGAGFGGQILSGQINGAETLAMATVDNVANGDLSAEHLVQNASATDYVANSILTARTNSYGREPDATRNFRSAASDAISSSGTQSRVSNNIFNSLSKV